MSDLRDYCERLWNGGFESVTEPHPVSTPYKDRQAEELAEGILYYKGIASATTLDTGDGLVMLDTGARNDVEPLYGAVRGWRPEAPLRAAVFSHHHVDHVFGVGPFDQEAEQGKAPRPVVYGQEAISTHFERYKKTPGWNGAINRRQFRAPDRIRLDSAMLWPTEFRLPDVTYRDGTSFPQGRLTFELHHCRGETEDATWTWVPEVRLLATGDLFIWAVPNAGNPQKAQRWVGEWAAGLREMSSLGADVMVPGHGWPIFGADRVRTALDETAAFLEDVEAQVLAMMNTGASLDSILHSVKFSQEALARPFMRPVYDHPEFLIHNVWRYYGGWWDGDADSLLPAPRSEQAREWIDLAGGLQAVLQRAALLKEQGNLRLASHLVESAVLAEPGSKEAHELRAEVYETRASLEASSMARNIFGFAAGSSRAGMRDAFERS